MRLNLTRAQKVVFPDAAEAWTQTKTATKPKAVGVQGLVASRDAECLLLFAPASNLNTANDRGLEPQIPCPVRLVGCGLRVSRH